MFFFSFSSPLLAQSNNSFYFVSLPFCYTINLCVFHIQNFLPYSIFFFFFFKLYLISILLFFELSFTSVSLKTIIQYLLTPLFFNSYINFVCFISPHFLIFTSNERGVPLFLSSSPFFFCILQIPKYVLIFIDVQYSPFLSFS